MYRISGMDLFEKAKAVRLRSHNGKYLMADEDEESVIQHRHGSSRAARWTVELLSGPALIRLKSCYGNYLTATHDRAFLLGRKGKVFQTLPQCHDYSVDWEPIREGNLVKLQSRQGTFLRANGGVPPWRNSVTHDHETPQPHMNQSILWDVAILEIVVTSSPAAAPAKRIPPENYFQPSPPPLLLAPVPGSFSRQDVSPPKYEGRKVY